MKTSKKQLKKEAEFLEAYYFTGNVYSYENIVHYIDIISYYSRDNREDLKHYIDEAFKNCNKNYYNSLKDLIESITSIKHDDYMLRQLYYSAGLYGNSGQMHELKLYNNNKIVGLYYLYY